MPRLRIDLAYNGAYFHGWAAQPGLRTVEGELSDALSTILRRPVSITVAGRTDAGVHARHQVAHIDVDEAETELLSVRRLQGLLTQSYSRLWGQEPIASSLSKLESRSGVADIWVKTVTHVSQDFDARFSALSRRYCYRIADAASVIDPIERSNVWWNTGAELDIDAMRKAAEVLLGEHDFLSFCRPREGATTIRTLKELTVERGDVIRIRPQADAFCHSMVRSLVGALVEVGRGRRDRDWFIELVSTPCRKHGVPIVPARGLTLEGVEYPEEAQWASRAAQARNRREGAHNL